MQKNKTIIHIPKFSGWSYLQGSIARYPLGDDKSLNKFLVNPYLHQILMQ